MGGRHQKSDGREEKGRVMGWETQERGKRLVRGDGCEMVGWGGGAD